MASTRRLAAIMFTDMVGSTASAQANEAEALKLRDEQEALVRPLFATHQGREVKSMGDGFLAEFDSALRAVQCAIDIQRRLHERNLRPDVAPIELRIGVHLGDVEQRDRDIFGDAVNVASRLQTIAEPGGICVSHAVQEQVRNKISDRLEKLPPSTPKGLQSAMDLYRVVLPWKAPPAQNGGPAPPRLAILPLANISPDPKDEYFADGLTEELISALSKIRDLRVIGRTSVGQYKSTSKTISQIGAELGVTSVLEGSVRKSGNRLRITLQLINTGTQDHLWSDSYDRDLDDVFAIQTEVAERTARALRLELLGPEPGSIRTERTPNLAAYNLYLKGIQVSRRSAHEGLQDSLSFFEEAIRNDPGFCPAYARLANVLITLAGETLPSGEAFPRAKELIAKAIELDVDSSEAHAARGNLALQYDHDYEVAETEFLRAVSLNPSNANAHYWYAHLLMMVKKFGDAARELRTTIELDPLWPGPKYWLGTVQSLSGDFDSAVASLEEARDTQPGNPDAHVRLGLIFADAARMADARREAKLSTGPVNKHTRWNRAILFARLGMLEEPRAVVSEWEDASQTEYVSPVWIAMIYAALGEKEKTIGCLERDDGEGARALWLYYQAHEFDSIREDPRFRSMLAKLNLA
ncbi:MAG: adenylate/guanylate cyclase domain-containing protein [Thermoplasmata archaeon]